MLERPSAEFGCSNYLHCTQKPAGSHSSSGTQLGHKADKMNWWGKQFEGSGRSADCTAAAAAVAVAVDTGRGYRWYGAWSVADIDAGSRTVPRFGCCSGTAWKSGWS